MTFEPFFSIIIPTFNREKFILRTLNSCLNQEFYNYEIIIIDDASTDKTVNIINNLNNNKIRLIKHQVNLGVGSSRNTGIDYAKGKWLIFLDSDDELLPNALKKIYGRSIDVPMNIYRLEFNVMFDNGLISPDPPLIDNYWNYYSYIEWMESIITRRSETFPVIKRTAFKYIKYPQDRSYETIFHLDFSKKFCIKTYPDIVRIYHFDANNQLIKPNIYRILKYANFQILSYQNMMKKHGLVLKKYAPDTYIIKKTGLLSLYMLTGKRMSGIKIFLTIIKETRINFNLLYILFFGLIDRKLLALMKYLKYYFFSKKI